MVDLPPPRTQRVAVDNAPPPRAQRVTLESAPTTETVYLDKPSQTLEGEQLNSEMTRVPEGGFQTMTRIAKGGYNRGNAGLELNNLYMREMFGERLDEGSLRRMAQLQEELGEGIKTRGLHQEMLRASSEQTPQLLSMADRVALRTTQGAGVGATAAMVFGQLGPQAAVPEEIVTVPAATLVGMKIGAHVGFIEHSFLQNSAEAFGEFSNFRDKSGVKMDEDLARFGSYLVGATNAGLDYVSLATFKKLFFGGNKVVDKLAANGKMIKVPESVDKARRIVTDAAVALGVESATEGVQEGTKEGVGELLKLISDQDFEPKTSDEIISTVGAAMKEAALATGGLAAGGVVTRTAMAVAQAKKEKNSGEVKRLVKDLEGQLDNVAREGDVAPTSKSMFVAEKMKNDEVLTKNEQPIADEMLAEARARLALVEGVDLNVVRESQIADVKDKSLAAKRDVDSVKQEALEQVQSIRANEDVSVGRLNEMLADFETLLSEQRQVTEPESLTDFIKSRKDLTNPTGGLRTQAAIESATDAGFFSSRPTRAAFDRALKRDTAGTDLITRPPTAQADSELSAVAQSLDSLAAELENAGIEGTTTEQLAALRKRIESGERKQVDPEIPAGSEGVKDIVPPPERITTDYEQIAAGRRDPLSTIAESSYNTFSDVMGVGSDVFTPVSTRLGKINPKLKTAVRKYVFNQGMRSTADKQAIKPFMDALPKMEGADYRVLDFALKNRDTKVIDEILAKYELTAAFADVRKTLDAVFAEAKEVGLDMNYIENYFPRGVKKDKVNEFLEAISGREGWSEIEAALKVADPESTYTADEKVAFINNYLRGFTSRRIMLARGGFTKERTIGYVDPELNKFYESSPHALLNYLNAVRHDIEARRLFGRGGAKSEESIGAYVKSMVDQGVIDAKNEQDTKKMLQALVEPQGTRGAVTSSKNIAYIYVMGNPISAITQIGDLAFSLADNGYYRTTKAFTKAVSRKSQFTKEDLGIENIIQEFDGESASSKAVRKVFRAVGLEYVDNVGKEVFINASYARLQDAARTNSAEFKQMMDVTFGSEAAQVTKDLDNGVITDNIKLLLFSELSDVQPISLAEMPVGYLRGGNMRVLYMLKTYTLKLLDIHRRKWIDEIASGDKARMTNGVRNLTKLGAALMLMGATSDVLKDLILGRDMELNDLVIDNILKTFGVSKYQIYKTRTEGLANAFWQYLLVPPIGAPINDLSKDLKVLSGEKAAKDAEVLQRIPVGGKLYFWWWGGGAAKKDRKKTTRRRARKPKNTRRRRER